MTTTLESYDRRITDLIQAVHELSQRVRSLELTKTILPHQDAPVRRRSVQGQGNRKLDELKQQCKERPAVGDLFAGQDRTKPETKVIAVNEDTVIFQSLVFKEVKTVLSREAWLKTHWHFVGRSL